MNREDEITKGILNAASIMLAGFGLAFLVVHHPIVSIVIGLLCGMFYLLFKFVSSVTRLGRWTKTLIYGASGIIAWKGAIYVGGDSSFPGVILAWVAILFVIGAVMALTEKTPKSM